MPLQPLTFGAGDDLAPAQCGADIVRIAAACIDI
jgi:hypothetical protein